MRLSNNITKQTIVNLLAEYILNELGPDTATQITVIDQGNFFVILGCTNTKKSLKLTEIFIQFTDKYSDLISEANYPKELSFVNFIRASNEDDLVTSCEINLYNTERPSINTICVPAGLIPIHTPDLLSSQFPHGYGLKTNRALLLYFEYIAYNIMDGTNTSEMCISFHKENEFEDKLQVKSVSLRDNEKIKSAILDLFDLDYTKFISEYNSYDFTAEVLNPNGEKPWLKKEIDTIDLLI